MPTSVPSPGGGRRAVAGADPGPRAAGTRQGERGATPPRRGGDRAVTGRLPHRVSRTRGRPCASPRIHLPVTRREPADDFRRDGIGSDDAVLGAAA